MAKFHWNTLLYVAIRQYFIDKDAEVVATMDEYF